MAELHAQFLSPAEVATLCALAEAQTSGWAPGRQHTGYEILSLRAPTAAEGRNVTPKVAPNVATLVTRALALIGTPFEDYWDVYFIRYLDGAYIPPHTDPAQHGRTHRRLNAVLAQAPSGGELLIGGVQLELAVGDAVLFCPDREVHEVSRVVGPRLLFSVGAWV